MDYVRVITDGVLLPGRRAVGRNSGEDTTLSIQIGVDKEFVFEEQQQKVLLNYVLHSRKMVWLQLLTLQVLMTVLLQSLL